MARVSFSVNDRTYDVACEDGQEDHLRQLAEYLDGTVARLVNDIGQVGESRLLVMAALMVADELYEARAGDGNAEADAAAAVEAVAERIEHIAARLEGA